MKFSSTALSGLVIIEPKVFEDERGWFMESFNQRRFEEGLHNLGLPLPGPFVQDNQSCSKKGVLRGLHFQAAPHAQGKLVRVVGGAAFDVVVDIRKDSATFLKWVGIELSSANKKMLWIPEGFAHGFLALEEGTQFLYKTTAYYDKAAEEVLLWNDASIGVVWPAIETVIVSEKDRCAESVSDYFLRLSAQKVGGV
ncbi:MAG: dTDP-4-dehydrorhamnose 3,5-epimerase [Pseudomonadota bacterium]